jgi:hypothetical protein
MTTNLKILVPEDTINYVKNPSVRYDTTGWTAVGSSISRVLSYALFGIASLKVVTSGLATREGTYYRVNDLSGISEPVTASAYVRGTGVVHLRLIEGLGKEWISDVVSLRPDRWSRLSASGFSTGSNDMRVYIETDTLPKAITFYATAVQMERKAYPTTYCDGDQPGCRWNIMNSSSNSSRSAYTRQGGKWVDLAGPCREDDDIYVTTLSGMGMAPLVNNVQPWALSPGSYYQNTKVLNRTITFSFNVKNPNMHSIEKPDLSKLHELRQQLIDIFKPDVTGSDEPFLLSYQEGERELFIPVRYEAGLEGDWDVRNSWVNSFPIRFVAVDPLFFENNLDAYALTFQTAKKVYGIVGRINGVWDWLNGGLGGGIGDGSSKCLSFSPRGILYSGGLMNGKINYGVGPGAGAAIVYWDGSTWTNLFAGVTSDLVNSMAIAPNGDIYATGNFTTIGGVAANRVAKWNGTTWSALGTGLNGIGYVIKIAPNGDIYVGGAFTTAGGLNRYYIARWDGGTWQSVGPYNGLNSYVYDIEISQDGSVIYVGGPFTDQYSLAGNALLRIASYSPSLNTFSAMGSGFDNVVSCISLTSLGIVYAAGNFTLSGSTTVNHIARWNGATWIPLGTGLSDYVRTMAISPSGEIAVGGDFLTAGGVGARFFALWNGSTWVSPDIYFSSPPGHIDIVTYSPSGDLYVAGTYIGYLNDPPTYINEYYTTYYTAINYIVNTGTAESKPKVYLYGSGKLRWLENQTTGKRVYFNLDILTGEEIMIDFGQGTIMSTVRGNLSYSILLGSDFGDFTLVPGTNKIAALMYSDVGASMYIYNQPKHWSADGTVNAGALS